MNHLQSENQQIIENRNTLILKNSFNIHFRNKADFLGAISNQYLFETSDHDYIGYQQFGLSGQPKMLKKYLFEYQDQRMVFLKKSEELFIIYPARRIELWKFDRFHICKKCCTIYSDDPFRCKTFIYDNMMIQEIGINQNEDMLVFQKFKEIFFYNKGKDGEWNLQQSIDSFNYQEMAEIRFNESNNIIVSKQTKFNKEYREHRLLTIFRKNQKDFWSATHHIKLNSPNDLLYFMDDQNFLYFEKDKNIKLIYEISKENYKAQIKSQETIEFDSEKIRYYDQLTEIKSKNLILLYCHYFFCLKQSKLLKLLTETIPEQVLGIGCNETDHCSSLFCQIHFLSGYFSKYKVCRIYIQ